MRGRGRALAGQVLSLTTWRVLAAGLQAAAFLALSRVATVPEVGVVGLVTAVGAFAAMGSDLGVATLISRARALGEAALVGGALRLNHITAAAFAVVASASVLVASRAGDVHPALALLLVSLALERHTETQLSVFFADRDARTPAVSIMSRRVVSLAVFGLLVAIGADGVSAYCAGQLAGNVVGSAHMAVAIRRTDAAAAVPARSLTVLRASWPFWLSGMLNQVRMLDIAVVGAIVGTYAAGLYAAAQRVTNPLLLIPTAMASLVLPHSTALGPGPAARLALRVSGMFTSLLVLVVPVAFIAEPLMGLLFGQVYRAAGSILTVVLAGLPFVALASPLIAILQSQGRERFVAAVAFVSAIATLGAVATGAATYSTIGAASAVGIVALLRCLVLFAAIWRHRHD